MFTSTRKIFIDSSVFIAFINRGSQNHLKASKAMEDLASIGYRLYTSSQVLTEAYNFLLEDCGNTIALEFLLTILQSNIEILYPQRTDFVTAHRILNVNRDKQIQMSEVLNATLMQKKGITQVLTFNFWNKLFGTNTSNLLSV